MHAVAVSRVADRRGGPDPYDQVGPAKGVVADLTRGLGIGPLEILEQPVPEDDSPPVGHAFWTPFDDRDGMIGVETLREDCEVQACGTGPHAGDLPPHPWRVITYNFCHMTSVRWLNPAMLSPQDVGRWTELARFTGTPNPFYEAGFALPALEHFGETELELLVAIDGAGDWVGLMPVERRRHWGRLVGASLTGWEHPHCFLASPLLDRDSADSVAEAMLREARREVGLIAFDRLPAKGPVTSALASACDALGAKPIVWKRLSERRWSVGPTTTM